MHQKNVSNQVPQQTIHPQNQASENTSAATNIIQPKLTDEQQKILDDFTPEMVEALGGIDKVMALPVLENWDGMVSTPMTAPVMRGSHPKGNFLLFSFFKFCPDTNTYKVSQECLLRKENGWKGADDRNNLYGDLSLNDRYVIKDNTEYAKHMLDKVSRLVKQEEVGSLELFPGGTTKKRPTNSYLEGEALDKFMKLDDVNFYERKPEAGATELFLYDPSISKEENTKILHRQFPFVYKPQLTAKQQKIINDFTPEMVEALGGVDYVLNTVPELKNWDGDFDSAQMQMIGPVVRGYHDNEPFLLFCFMQIDADKKECVTKLEYLERVDKGWESKDVRLDRGELGLEPTVEDHTLAAHHMLDKISRLMKREAVGALKRYLGGGLIKPKDKDVSRPTDAYLEGEEIEKYMDLNTMRYERKPQDGTTELFLYAPKLSDADNLAFLHRKFPQMAQII